MQSNQQRKLDTVINRLQNQYGPTAIRKAAPATEPIASVSTTFTELDEALGGVASTGGNGGLPRGRITEIIGPATSGKVTLAAKVLSSAHREREALSAWVDMPGVCDPDYLHRCGVDLSRLLVVRPHDSGDALAISLHLVESNTLTALVFDGATCLAQSEFAILAGTLERLATVVTQTQTVVIFLTDPRAAFRTLAHVASVRLALQRERWLMLGNDVRGYESQVELLKHRLGRPGTLAPLRILFGDTER